MRQLNGPFAYVSILFVVTALQYMPSGKNGLPSTIARPWRSNHVDIFGIRSTRVNVVSAPPRRSFPSKSSAATRCAPIFISATFSVTLSPSEFVARVLHTSPFAF